MAAPGRIIITCTPKGNAIIKKFKKLKKFKKQPAQKSVKKTFPHIFNNGVLPRVIMAGPGRIIITRAPKGNAIIKKFKKQSALKSVNKDLSPDI